jgi:hypothetical protein
MIKDFVATLSMLPYPEVNPRKPRPKFDMRPDYIKFVLMGSLLKSENNGSGWMYRFSQRRRQWVATGGAPLITIQVPPVFYIRLNY